MVNLSAHTRLGLSEEDVLKTILEKRTQLHEENGAYSIACHYLRLILGYRESEST